MLGHFVNVLRTRDRKCLHCGCTMPYTAHECPKCHYSDEDEIAVGYGRVRTREYMRERNRSYIFLGIVALGIVLMTLIFGVIF